MRLLFERIEAKENCFWKFLTFNNFHIIFFKLGSLWVLQLHCNRAAIFCIEKKLYLAQWAKSVVFNSIQLVCIKDIASYLFAIFFVNLHLWSYVFYTDWFRICHHFAGDFLRLFLGCSHLKIDYLSAVRYIFLCTEK